MEQKTKKIKIHSSKLYLFVPYYFQYRNITIDDKMCTDCGSQSLSLHKAETLEGELVVFRCSDLT